MSGLTAAYGNSTADEVHSMMEVIDYRGRSVAGVFEGDKIIMGQNYLRADTLLDENEDIPVGLREDGLRICYDGQMGNWAELAAKHGVPDGPFREERLLLQLYKKYGTGMLKFLSDSIFAFIISDGKNFFAARDLLGIKTLFCGKKGAVLYFASELKSLTEITDDVYEFPAGHYLTEKGKFTPYDSLPGSPPETYDDKSIAQMTTEIRAIIDRSLRRRVDLNRPTGSLLSGGLDSSVIAYLTAGLYKKKFGKDAKLKTFALGVGESGDIKNARIMAEHIGSEHYEVIIDLQDILGVLPEVIYYLESFDPSLVRSAVSNFIISKYARKQGIEVLLSGEGGDEVFCGYSYMKRLPQKEIFRYQMECLSFLHNNASLRLDRMNLCNSIKVVAPLISGELLEYSLKIPDEYKIRISEKSNEKIEKWIFRKAYEKDLPESIVWRVKQEFSQGSGSAKVLPAYFEEKISDKEFNRAKADYPQIRSKEELYYFRIFSEYFGDNQAVKTVGQWVSV